MLPTQQQNQLASYYEDEILKRGNQHREPGYSGIGYWWYGYPIHTNAVTEYGAMSTASTAPNANETVVDPATDVAGDGAQSLG